MILTIKQPNKYYEMKTALRERLLSIAESWHLCSRLRARQVRSAFSSFPFKCRMKRALWSACWRETPSLLRLGAVGKGEKEASEPGKAVQQEGEECGDATPVPANGDSSAGVPPSQPAELGIPLHPRNIHIPMADAGCGSPAPAWGEGSWLVCEAEQWDLKWVCLHWEGLGMVGGGCFSLAPCKAAALTFLPPYPLLKHR